MQARARTLRHRAGQGFGVAHSNGYDSAQCLSTTASGLGVDSVNRQGIGMTLGAHPQPYGAKVARAGHYQ